MRVRTLFALLVLLACQPLASAAPLIMGTRPLGLAGAFTALEEDAIASPLNPAAISMSRSFRVLGYYSFSNLDNTYDVGSFVTDSLTSAIAMSLSFINMGYLPVRKVASKPEQGSVSITHNYYGMAVAEYYNNLFAIGMNFELHTLRSDLGNDDTFTWDLGIIVPVGSYLQVGLTAHNILNYGYNSLRYENDPRRRGLSMGIKLFYQDKIALLVDWYRDLQDLSGNRHRIAVGLFAVGKNYFEVRVGYARDFFLKSNEIGAGVSFKAPEVMPRFKVSYSYFTVKTPYFKNEERHSISATVFFYQ